MTQDTWRLCTDSEPSRSRSTLGRQPSSTSKELPTIPPILASTLLDYTNRVSNMHNTTLDNALHTRPVPDAPWCGNPYCGKADPTALLLSSLNRAPGGVLTAGPWPPGSSEQSSWFPPLQEHPSNGAFCPAERTRSTGQGSRPLPVGIEVYCRP